MKIAIGSDHAGFLAKEEVAKFLKAEGHVVIDEGTNSIDSCDYPIYGKRVAEDVAKGLVDYGVLICSTGEGISIAANKVKGVRAGIAYNDETATLMRQHNNANIISFGAKFMPVEDIERRIKIFLSTEFLGERHQRRVDMIEK